MEQKKKSSNYIIPATFFTSLSPTTKKQTVVNKTVQTPKAVPVKPTETKTEIVKPVLKNIKRRTSALSLKSIHQKKEIKSTLDEEESYDNHPRTPFTQEELEAAWKKYFFKLQEEGEKSIAAVIASNTPLLGANFQIQFSLPSDFMKAQLEKGKPKLMRYLREQFNNYGLQINLVVNETVEKKFAYTPKEKYDKLKEKNPLIEKLKNTFGLDL